MMSETEQGEPTPELGAVDQAREIYSHYRDDLNQDPQTMGEIDKAMETEGPVEKTAVRYANSSARQGYSIMVVGFLERTNLSERERFRLLAKSEGNAYENAFRMVKDLGKKVQEDPKDKITRACKIVASLETGRCRRRASTFRQAVREISLS